MIATVLICLMTRVETSLQPVLNNIVVGECTVFGSSYLDFSAVCVGFASFTYSFLLSMSLLYIDLELGQWLK